MDVVNDKVKKNEEWITVLLYNWTETFVIFHRPMKCLDTSLAAFP